MLSAMIRRPRLTDALRGAPSVVALVAAPGYGKTTLLREWDAVDPRDFVWLDEGDRVAHAAARVEDAPASVLVVDDVHAVPPAQISALIDLTYAPPGSAVTVVFAGRSIDAQVLARLRLGGVLVELGEPDLAFDEEEAREVLGRGAESASVARLMQRTEGWPTGIRLAAIAATDGVAIGDFSGRDRLVQQYVHAVLDDRIDDAELAALRRLAAVDAVSGALGDAALDRRDTQRLLDRLASEHLFVAPTDREGEWFRIHPTVREALQLDLERHEPGTGRAVRARAVSWLVQNGRPADALALSLRNGDRIAALGLLADVVLPMFYRGDLAPVVDMIHGIGPDVAVGSGYLATMFAYAGAMTGDTVCAERWSAAAERHYAAHRFASDDEEVAYFTLRAHLAPRGIAVMREDADRAAALVGESSAWRVPAIMLSGMAAALAGDARAATRALDAAIHLGVEDAATPGLIMAIGARVLLGAQPGSASDEAALLAQAVEASAGFRGYPQSALPLALAAADAARAQDLDRAATLFTAAHALRPILGRALPWMGVQLRVALARAAVALSDPATARLVIAEAEELLAALPDARGLRRAVTDLARSLEGLPATGGAASSVRLLTSAELRLLPELPTHRSFEEIGRRLHLSRNTIKTQALSVYRKLGASSRSEAVERARLVGLIPD